MELCKARVQDVNMEGDKIKAGLPASTNCTFLTCEITQDRKLILATRLLQGAAKRWWGTFCNSPSRGYGKVRLKRL